MFQFFAQRNAARSAADDAAANLMLTIGGPAAMATIRRDLRWLDPADNDRERELTFVLRALEKRMHYHPPIDAATPRFLDNII